MNEAKQNSREVAGSGNDHAAAANPRSGRKKGRRKSESSSENSKANGPMSPQQQVCLCAKVNKNEMNIIMDF